MNVAAVLPDPDIPLISQWMQLVMEPEHMEARRLMARMEAISGEKWKLSCFKELVNHNCLQIHQQAINQVLFSEAQTLEKQKDGTQSCYTGVIEDGFEWPFQHVLKIF